MKKLCKAVLHATITLFMREKMKKFRILQFLLCGILATACNGQPEKEKEEKDANPSEMKLNKKDVSYALGYNIGDVLSKTDENLNTDDLIKGFLDAFSKADSPRMNEVEIKNTLMMYNFEMSKQMEEKLQKAKLENVQKGQAFVADYEKESGVMKDESGLYYKVIEKGNGPIPTAQDTVLVDYTGKKIDGEVFFSTSSQGQPAQFTVENVIKGWVTALQKMPVGSTWEIVIPPELGYGDQGVSDVIAPGETLIFELTLKEIVENPSERND